MWGLQSLLRRLFHRIFKRQILYIPKKLCTLSALIVLCFLYVFIFYCFIVLFFHKLMLKINCHVLRYY
uniref:Ion transport domain-containing protein n=1 Tax=Anguilla anguilla TaxID=7936 RepID=A0A0E9UCP3_ANGAN